MPRIAFIVEHLDASWLGGLNYFKSLMKAVKAQRSSGVEPVIIVPDGTKEKARAVFPDLEILETSLVRERSILQRIRERVFHFLERDLLFEEFLRINNIDLVSHGHGLGRGSRIPSIAWIPDFQQLHLTDFFSADEKRWRERQMNLLAANADKIIVSSHDARQDLQRFLPKAAHKGQVMHFVPGLDGSQITSFDLLAEKYAVRKPYLFLPNQFWLHKNHEIVLRALIRAKAEGVTIQVVSTGATTDYRNPGHFIKLTRLLEENGLEADFRILGVVPYTHMLSLMYHAKALLNPSLFEGWSTTVEEGKLLGKRLVLSRIGVHREQAGENAIYFDPRSIDGCYAALVRACEEPETPPISLAQIQAECRSKQHEFGARYLHIVKTTLSKDAGTIL